jgi:hypothetical protein
MKKILILLLTIMVMAYNARSQHQIITNDGDTIIGKINELNDGTYSYWKLTKPKGPSMILQSKVKQLIAIGPDTLFDTYKNVIGIPDTINFVNEDDFTEEDNSAGGYLIRAGNSQIIARVIYIIGGPIGVAMGLNGDVNGVYVAAGGIVVGNIIDFAASSLIIKAGDKLKQEEFERNKVKK